MSLRSKAIKGFSWSVFENVFSQGTVFVVYIILARLLSPEDFGTIAIIMAIVSISNTLADGGLSSALIQKKNPTNDDYNSVFFINFLVSCFLYLVLVLFAKPISLMYDDGNLPQLLYVTGSILVIRSFSTVQFTMMDKNLDFKTASIINVLSTAISGIMALVAAYLGSGIWSLVVFSISEPLIETVLALFLVKWKPSFIFVKDSFMQLLNFGYKLLLAELLSSLYRNLHFFVIGYSFSTKTLGFYTKAQQFQAPLSGYITGAISNISFPVLSTVQDDSVRLKSVFSKFLKFSVYINFTAMAMLAAMAKPLVLILIGDKWSTSVFYLQLLCIPGMLYPLQLLNLDVLVVKGLSNKYLRLEVIKKTILIPLLIASSFFSIEIMLYALAGFAILEYFINTWYNSRLIDYGALEQINDLIPYFIMSITIFLSVYGVSLLDLGFIGDSMYKLFFTQIVVAGLVFVIYNEIFQFEEYLEVKKRIGFR